MKTDFRLKYPLWMMAFIALLGVFAYGINSPSTKRVNTSSNQSVIVEIGAFEGLLIFGAMVVYLVLITIFFSQVKKHNKEKPNQKISLLSIRPLEYLEQDEGMTHITRVAVQKVYTYYTWALPVFTTIIIIMPLSRLVIIFGILAIAFIQYLIYYLEVRKHFKEEAE
ncbi:hypothetical protein B0H99_108116 [Planomicrobium soli]|uniref:DUF3169 family protein n=1 Tax=Planomicrobium soli TaxID=1176648 RepID=A0A2P8GML8_9BACL|nr:hypothetical protein [Planomicrobium soli]PSL35210.1 hypothetical protein B0H99_108116 [Planomicrobium soli]